MKINCNKFRDLIKFSLSDEEKHIFKEYNFRKLGENEIINKHNNFNKDIMISGDDEIIPVFIMIMKW